MNSKVKFRIFSIFSVIFLCIGLTYRNFQNDTFYIIKLGEFISERGIDLVDHYSWVANLSYTYPHWLYDLFLYYVYNLFGNAGVFVSVIFCFILLVLCVYFVHSKMHKNEFASFFVAVITVFSLYMFAVARSQIISLPLFVLEVYFISKLIDTGKNKYIFYLCILSLIIANVHATTWLFYFVLFLPFMGEHFFNKLSKNNFIRKLYRLDKCYDSKIIVGEISNFKKLLLAMLLCLLMGFFTPSMICFSYVFRVMMGNSQNVLLEHLPLVVLENPIFICFVAVFVIVLSNSKTKVYLRELFMICGLLLMSLISTRHLSFFYTIALLYITIVALRCLESIGDRTFDILFDLVIKNKIVYVVILFIILSYSGYRFYQHSSENYISKEDYPVDAVNYIRKNLDYKNIRLYNGYNYGSYLLFYDIPVFIDSRCDLYLKEFNGMDYSIFDDIEDIHINYEEKFLKYGVSHVLISKEELLYFVVSKDNNYTILYEDDNFVLFERLV